MRATVHAYGFFVTRNATKTVKITVKTIIQPSHMGHLRGQVMQALGRCILAVPSPSSSLADAVLVSVP